MAITPRYGRQFLAIIYNRSKMVTVVQFFYLAGGIVYELLQEVGIFWVCFLLRMYGKKKDSFEIKRLN